MGKFIMVAQSQAIDGRDDELNAWYDGHHFSEICSLPGVTGGRRFEASMMPMGPAGQKYLAIYEIQCDHPGTVMAELGRRLQSGEMTPSPEALDLPNATIWFYEQREGY